MALEQLAVPLSEKNAAHLLRRATFGPTIKQIKDFTGKTVTQAMDLLFDTAATNPLPPKDSKTSSSWVNPPTQRKAVEETNSEQEELHEFFKAWHVDVMMKSGATINERIAWFYHTHLPARWTRIKSSEAIYYQNCIFRYYALGSFKELFKKICADNAMLKYLDGATNRKNSPNENFAREMFELYSIGRGEQIAERDYTTFTEDDVKSATNVLTGWVFDEGFSTDDPDHGWPTGYLDATGDVPNHHNTESKTFSSKFSGQTIEGGATVSAATAELGNMIDMIFDNDATAKAIVRKLYRFFVYHFISESAESNIITPLATTLKANNYEIHTVLKELFASKYFYDDDNSDTSDDTIAAIIKSPVDLVLGALRFFEVDLPDRETETATFYSDMKNGVLPRFMEQGLNFYEPFEVAGYPPYHQKPGYARNWIMPSELAYRYQIGERLMQRPSYPTDFSFKIDALDWVQNSGYISNPGDSSEVVDILLKYMLAVDLDADRKNYFLNTVFLDTFNPSTWQSEWNAYTSGGSADTVKGRLEILVSSIMQSPEYQMH